MYLSKRTYVRNWNHTPIEDRNEIIVKKGEKLSNHIKSDRVSYVIEEVAYWRKFNALHQWFVDNCQEGIDDCKEYPVYHEQIEHLLKNLKKIGKSKTKAKKYLPVSQGFFFGSYEYDEDYFQSLEETIEIFKDILKDDSEGTLYYQSSW